MSRLREEIKTTKGAFSRLDSFPWAETRVNNTRHMTSIIYNREPNTLNNYTTLTTTKTVRQGITVCIIG